ncbi:unnamed protein product [Auanema sp. JU1783]|nr:unnamed protein product [Auanema sp. JU1783]
MSKNAPVFVHHGVDATCCSTVCMDNREFLLVGTSKGKCHLCDIFSYQFKETVYEDSDKRSIVGAQARLHENVLEAVVHIRDYAIMVLARKEGKWDECRVIPVNHYGFCSFILIPDAIILPDVEKSDNLVRILWDSGNADIIPLGNKATPFCLNSFESSVLVGDEAGTLTISKNGFMRKKSLYSEPIFGLAVSTSGLIAACSTLPPIKCFRMSDLDDKDIISLDYRPDASGCGSLVFLPSEKTLLAGYWDGAIRGFSIKKRQVILFLDFHKETITRLCWFGNMESGETKKDQMVSCSKDGTICFWNFPKH